MQDVKAERDLSHRSEYSAYEVYACWRELGRAASWPSECWKHATGGRMKIILAIALAGLCITAPAAVYAQAPVVKAIWGSYGTGPGQFDRPQALATDAQ